MSLLSASSSIDIDGNGTVLPSILLQSSAEPYYQHTLVEDQFAALSSWTIPLAAMGFVACAVWHVQSEPALQFVCNCCDCSCSWWIKFIFLGKPGIILCYVLPFVLFTDFWIVYPGNEVGAAAQLAGCILDMAMIEGPLNLFFFGKNSTHRIYPRLGRRVLFVAMVALLCAGRSIDEYNSIDYYGAIRISEVGFVEVGREQKGESHNSFYSYSYRLTQKVEWGDSWACQETPMGKHYQWCSKVAYVFTEECQAEIFCQGRPEDYAHKYGACPSAVQIADAYANLTQCFNQQATQDGSFMGDFASAMQSPNLNWSPLSWLEDDHLMPHSVFSEDAAAAANFTRSVAPWDDPNQPPTVTRLVRCGSLCMPYATTPETLARQVAGVWMTAIALVLVGAALLAVGVRKGQEQEARVPVVFAPVSTIEGAANELELSPVAHAEPVV